MRTELISIETETDPLDGALYFPDGASVRGGILLFHGNVMNFYTGSLRFLPPVLTELGFACLAFNRRSHDILATHNSRAPVGGAFQLVANDIADNQIAAAWIAAQGFPDPIVIGHSNGGVLATEHVAEHPGAPGLILLSAHRGGNIEARLRQGEARNGMYAEDKHAEFLSHAETLVAQGRGRELMLLPGWWHAIAAESYLDRMSNMPDLIGNAAKIACPVLFIRGDEESSGQYPAEEFKASARGLCDVEIIGQCNHYYVGRADAVCETVSRWLVQKFPR